MDEFWQVTEALEACIARAVEDAGLGEAHATHRPSVMWSSGGHAESPGRPTIPIPPGYTVGMVLEEKLASFTTVPSTRFGRIAFLPSPIDATSARRKIDYDGTDIVVR